MSSWNCADMFGRADGGAYVQVTGTFRQCANVLKGHMNIINKY
jgi:hypothetical protein